MALSSCIEKFLGRLPNKPTVLQAFGESLHKFFDHAPDHIGGIYRVSIAGTPDIRTHHQIRG